MDHEPVSLAPVAVFSGPLKGKFGLPRQSGLVEDLVGYVEFCSPYRSREAVRGLEDYDYIWLIWGFSHHQNKAWSPTVRPPRLGGNERMGVFATRSSYRPNGLGLSSVRLLGIEEGPRLRVGGADLGDGTPIYDIKPYIPRVDAHPGVRAGFVDHRPMAKLDVVFESGVLDPYPLLQRQIEGLIALDPRPAYQDDPARTYYFEFEDLHIGFRVDHQVARVVQIERQPAGTRREESL